jgi:pyruvate/oxaloacetate carboxyltransferase
MKNMKLMTLAVLAGALLLGYSSVFAHEGEEHAKAAVHSGEPGKTSGGMSTHDGMTALYAHLQEIDAQLKPGKLEGMHEHAEAIEAATKDLDKDSTLDATKKKRVQGYMKNVAKLADKLHDAADEKKLDETKKAFGQLKAQVDLLDKQFAHSHKPSIGEKHVKDGNTKP